jgi:8-oxo-dGTP diphosphatase
MTDVTRTGKRGAKITWGEHDDRWAGRLSEAIDQRQLHYALRALADPCLLFSEAEGAAGEARAQLAATSWLIEHLTTIQGALILALKDRGGASWTELVRLVDPAETQPQSKRSAMQRRYLTARRRAGLSADFPAEKSPEDAGMRHTADVVCIRDGHVLVIQRRKAPFIGQWALPGGHLEVGEASIAAAARELQEETGVRVPTEALTRVGLWNAPGRDPRGPYSTTAYVCHVPADTTATAADDAADIRWLPLGDAHGLAFDHDEIVQAAIRLQS